MPRLPRLWTRKANKSRVRWLLKVPPLWMQPTSLLKCPLLRAWTTAFILMFKTLMMMNELHSFCLYHCILAAHPVWHPVFLCILHVESFCSLSLLWSYRMRHPLMRLFLYQAAIKTAYQAQQQELQNRHRLLHHAFNFIHHHHSHVLLRECSHPVPPLPVKEYEPCPTERVRG